MNLLYVYNNCCVIMIFVYVYMCMFVNVYDYNGLCNM